MWLKILVAFILIGIIAPILIVFPLSFTSLSYFKFPPSGYSMKWYLSFFQDSQWVDVFVRSIEIALFTSVLSLIIGTMAAYAVIRINFWGKRIFMGIMIAPMIIPVIVVGAALYSYFADLKLTNTITGLVLAHSISAIPVVFVSVLSGLKDMDINLERAAIGLGATPIRAFFKVTVPIIGPSFFSGAIFAFMISFDEIVLSIFVSGPSTKTLPVKMWENLNTNVDPTIASVSTIMITLTIAAFFLQELIIRGAKKRKIKN